MTAPDKTTTQAVAASGTREQFVPDAKSDPGTEYVILERMDGRPDAWREFARETARSAETAIKQALEGNTDGGTFVAVSARSFKPITVTPLTVTTLKLEEAK